MVESGGQIISRSSRGGDVGSTKRGMMEGNGQ